MRLSAKKGDPGYTRSTYGATVLLDGKEIKDVLTADEEAGYVVVYLRNSEGHFMLNDTRTEIVSKSLHGSVQINLPVVSRP
jgi:hypothetical protein